MKILLERGDVDPDRLDIFGETLLWHASGCGHAGLTPHALVSTPKFEN